MKNSIHRLACGLLCASGLLAMSTAQEAQAAAYATGGSGQYRNEVLWLTWGGGGANGTHGVVLANGNSTSATIQVTATEALVLTCSLAGISGSIESYRPGVWSGDGLDELYNIGGTGSANQLIAGIMGRTGEHSFTVNCQATLDGQPFRIPGLVVADAESMNTTTEYLTGTAAGQWNVVEMNRGNGNRYDGLKTNLSGGLQSIRLGSPGGEAGGTTSPVGIAFLTFDDSAYGANESISMSFEIRGGGNTAIAIGLLAPAADFGDAPGSYGDAVHRLRGLAATPDGLVPGTATNINALGFPLGALTMPAGDFLGSAGPDGEPGSQYSATANGDDSGGRAGAGEENAWPSGVTLSLTQLQVDRNVTCVGTGAVAGWIDFDRSGTFDADERAQAACGGGAAMLSWAVPADVSPGRSYVRLRYATTPADVQLPTGIASDGEAEDHPLDIELAVDVSLVKGVTPGSAIAGQEVTYTLDIGNAGPFAADGAIVQDPAVPGLDCSAATPTCSAAGNAQCPASPTIAGLQGAGLTIPALPVGGTIHIEFACTVSTP